MTPTTTTTRPWRDDFAPRAPARPDAVLQRRGLERMQTILDAAEAIMAVDGYEAATLKAVSERTGIPTASLYHYFLDRYQVDRELALRHIDALSDVVMTSLETVTSATRIDALVAAVLNPMIDYCRKNPSCIELWFGHRTTGHHDVVRLFDEATAEHVHRLAIETGQLHADTPLLVIQLAFEVGTHLFDVAFQTAPGYGDEATFDEIRMLLSEYLKAYTPDRKPHE